jgi:hypothetical protein
MFAVSLMVLCVAWQFGTTTAAPFGAELNSVIQGACFHLLLSAITWKSTP